MPRAVLIVVNDKVNIFTLMSMVEAFTSVNFRFPDRPQLHYEVRIASFEGGMVEAWNGFHIDALPLSQFEHRAIDTLIVSGGWGFLNAIRNRALVRWISTTSKRCRRVCAVGGGLFLAAEAGLLANRRVAIHPVIYAEFSKRYLSCIADQHAIFTCDETVWTSPGMSAAVDVALAMIEEDLGRSVAIAIARFLVVYVKRRGEEPQLSSALQNQSHSDKFEELHAWILANLSSDITLEVLARKAGRSVRNFSRVYRTAFGRTPMDFVHSARLEVAARALTSTTERVSEIAYESGFSSEEQMRRHFRARYGISPSRYRAVESDLSNGARFGRRRTNSPGNGRSSPAPILVEPPNVRGCHGTKSYLPGPDERCSRERR